MSNPRTSARPCCSLPVMPPATSPDSSSVSTPAASSRSSRGRARRGAVSMPKGIMYLQTMPVSPDKDADYNKWYNDTHLAEIVSVEGLVSARRFAPTGGHGPSTPLSALACDHLDAPA